MHNIIIYFKYPMIPTKGGVERVSVVLGSWLISQGYKVYYLSDIFDGESSIFVYNNLGLEDDENYNSLKRFVKEKEIDLIINQAAFLPCCRRLFDLGREVKIVSVFHQALDGMFAHPAIPFFPWKYSWHFSRSKFFEYLFRGYFYLKYHRGLGEVVKRSDSVVILSEQYFKETEFYACKSDKMVAIGNPLTLPVNNTEPEKENVLLFVGRLSWQKNPYILLSIWKRIYSKLDNWKLYVIGDGEGRAGLEEYAHNADMKNVYFEGTQNPIPYLEKAKILCMTSMYEAFPLVLFEAMNYGVVPVVFDTFQSSHEIISDGVDGYIIRPFDEASYIERLMAIITQPSLYTLLSENAKKKALDNTIDHVGPSWIELFESLS